LKEIVVERKGTEKSHVRVMKTGIPKENRSDNLLNTTLQHYRYINLFHNFIAITGKLV
jgi:hypothetical protein